MRAAGALVAAFAMACAQLPAQVAVPQAGPPFVATHYFYWYRWPTEHFDEPGAPGHEGHRRHLAHPEQVSYLSVDWHRTNFQWMAEAGIDAALPVYWGAPGAYERPNLAFSRLGLPPMVAALEDLDRRHERAPKLGLFYDTSTLANDVCGREPRGGRADLTTDAGRELFCTTVTDYFAAIPERHWALHRGGALVVLYVSGFASKWDKSLGDALRKAFAARFPGRKACLVADESWGDIGQDLTTSWGAALWGPKLFPGVAQIGAGYDDSPVPGRHTPLREREDGAFYDFSWQRAIAQKPELVLLETWNEMHEGTELCPTKEAGRQYLDRTKAWIERSRSGAAVGAPVVLQWAEPRARPDLSWGEDAQGRDDVHADFARGERSGLREVRNDDGPFAIVDGMLCPGTVPSGMGSYLYFQVSDHCMFDGDAAWQLEVVRAKGPRLWIEYDSTDSKSTLAGAYTAQRARSSVVDGDVVTETYDLSHARFANRENGGADLRLVLPDRAVAVRRITLRRVR